MRELAAQRRRLEQQLAAAPQGPLQPLLRPGAERGGAEGGGSVEAGGGAALVEAGATQPPSTSGREAADDVAAPLHRPAASLMSGLPQRSAAGDGEGFCIGSSAVGAAFFQRRCGAGRPATVGGSSEEQAGPGQESAAGRGGEVGWSVAQGGGQWGGRGRSVMQTRAPGCR